jgi:hypothetical protein
MRSASNSILTVAALSFLAIQVCSTHFHADSGTHDAAESHYVHLQSAFAHDENHNEAHVDLSFFEVAATLSKADSIITATAMPASVAISTISFISLGSSSNLINLRKFRWRPPSRAPPSF